MCRKLYQKEAIKIVDLKNWQELNSECSKDYFAELMDFLAVEYSIKNVYPEKKDIFNAFKHTSYDDTKVVIIGQDPYHGKGQAHGLCFSVKKNIAIPRSLKNIFKELNSSLGCPIPTHGNLISWANQGVLLLNNVLTVVESKPNAHRNKGWELFTSKAIELLNNKHNPVVFMLWGNNARKKKKLITNDNHLILESAHPSPLSASRGFFGNSHFKLANDFLIKHYKKPINWCIK